MIFYFYILEIISFLLFLFFYCCSITVVSIFLPTVTFTPAIPSSHPWCYPLLVLSMFPLYMFLKTPPPFPPFIPSHLTSGYCQFVLKGSKDQYFCRGETWVTTSARWARSTSICWSYISLTLCDKTANLPL